METATWNNADQTVEEGFMIEPDFLWKQQIWVWILGTGKGQDLGLRQCQQEPGSRWAVCVQRVCCRAVPSPPGGSRG